MNMKNVLVVMLVGVACLFAGAGIQRIRMQDDTEFQPKNVVAHKECVGCHVNKCPCGYNCNCEFCLCADKEVSFAFIRKQLERIDQSRDCYDRETVIANREWIDWVVGYKKK